MARGRKGAKKGMRKGRKMLRKKAISNMNANTFSTACRWNAGTIAMTGTGPVANYIYGSGSALSGVWSVKQTREFAVYSKIFDQYRVTGVTLRYYPRGNVESISEANVQNASAGFPSSQYIFSSFDIDSPLPSNINAIQTLRSTRKHNLLKSWTRSFRYTYKDNSWLDTDLSYDTSPPVSNWVAKGLYGNFGFYAENVPYAPGSGSPVVAQVEVIYHVVFRGQRLVNVSQTEDGNITIGNPEPDMKPQSDFVVQSGLKPVDDVNECDLEPVVLAAK